MDGLWLHDTHLTTPGNAMGLVDRLLLTRSVRTFLLLVFILLLAIGILSGETRLIRIESATL